MTNDDKQGKSRPGNPGAAAMPGADFLESIQNFWEGMPKYPLDMAQNLSGAGGGKMLEDTTKVASRMFEFGQARVQADMNFMAELAQCKNPEDFMSLQKEWFETAVKDYQENNAELVKAGMQMFADGVEAAEEAAEKVTPKK